MDVWLSRSSLAGVLLAATSCGSAGTDLSQLDGQNPSTDGGGAMGSNPPPTSYQDPFSGAPGYSASGGGGDNSHHAGESCMGGGGCHSSAGGGEAPCFLIGGTVYQDYYGTVAAAGVEVRILDSAGHAASTHSGSNGNFYIRCSSNNGVTFPAVIGARNATATRPMITPLSGAAMGSCGQSPCHVAMGSPAKTKTYYPIHVP